MEKLAVIRTLSELKALQEYLADKDFIALDTETTGVEKGSEIIGYSVSCDPQVGYYVVLSHWDVLNKTLIYWETQEGTKDFFQSLQGKRLVLQNAVFDCSMIQDNYGVSLIESVHTDTMLLAHLLNENRPCGLKELGIAIFGEDEGKEQAEMKASVTANGGQLTKANYELYKADSELIARYGAKDAILTLKVFYHLVPELFEQGLDKFFYEEETMPLLRGPTYELNTEGLRVDTDRLALLRSQLEADIMDAKAFIYKEITPTVKDKYPGTGKTNTFNIGATQQLAWLLFERLGQPFHTLTDEGKVVCKFLGLRLPYALAHKREFIRDCVSAKGRIYSSPPSIFDTSKKYRPKKIGDWWKYVKADKETLAKYADRYQWVKRFQTYNKDLKLLNTYVTGIQERMKYGIIRPSFLQHGTTSGRYSSRGPNFQNLPRDDKRIKACIIAREGEVLIGADQSQLEVRVFASQSQDQPLLDSFERGEDFYSSVGMPLFNVYDCTPHKEGSPEAFGVKYKQLRNISKPVSLSVPYGTIAPQLASVLGKSREEAQQIIDNYWINFPGVHRFQLESHEFVKTNGVVYSNFGRPRRIPAARMIPKKAKHEDLPYPQRQLLNLAVNHRVQSTAASVMNRCAIRFHAICKERGWTAVKVILQVHDSLVARCPKSQAAEVSAALEEAMTETVSLPGVSFEAKPKIGLNLSEVS